MDSYVIQKTELEVITNSMYRRTEWTLLISDIKRNGRTATLFLAISRLSKMLEEKQTGTRILLLPILVNSSSFTCVARDEEKGLIIYNLNVFHYRD